MKIIFIKFVVLFVLTSCSNINFLLDNKQGLDFLKNKTDVYVSGWNNPALKEELFLVLGESKEKQFILKAEVNEKQTKRSVGENQVAQKIDYKIVVNYTLDNINKKCPVIKNQQASSFSFAPKSSGSNFASDVLLQNLYKEVVSNNVNNFIIFANAKLESHNCFNEN